MSIDIKSINTVNRYAVQLKKNIINMDDLITSPPILYSLNDYRAYVTMLLSTPASEVYALYGYRLLAVLYNLRERLLVGTKMNNDNYRSLIYAIRVLLYENNVYNNQD